MFAIASRVSLQIAGYQIVALFGLQDLRQRIAPYSSLDGILNVSHVELKPRGLLAVHLYVQIGLPEQAEDSQVFDAGNGVHDLHNFVRFVLQRSQVVAINLGRKLPLDAAHRFLHVVGDGLREIPDRSRDLFHFPVHGGDQLFLVLVKYRTPLFFRLQVHAEFGVEETGGVRPVVRASYLAGDDDSFGKRRQREPRQIGDADALSGTGRERPAHPQGVFVQMREELGANNAAGGEIQHRAKRKKSDRNRHPAFANTPAHGRAIA